MGFASGSMFAGFVFLFFSAVVAVSDNIVRPYMLKGGGELHPLVGFVAAFGGLNAMGFYGLFIGPVLAGIFFTILPMVTRGDRDR
jgi:predicted PurR-regulated permease PerM